MVKGNRYWYVRAIQLESSQVSQIGESMVVYVAREMKREPPVAGHRDLGRPDGPGWQRKVERPLMKFASWIELDGTAHSG